MVNVVGRDGNKTNPMQREANLCEVSRLKFFRYYIQGGSDIDNHLY